MIVNYQVACLIGCGPYYYTWLPPNFHYLCAILPSPNADGFNISEAWFT